MMRNDIGGIDHAVFAVRDLDAAHDSFERMGFLPDAARPPHAGVAEPLHRLRRRLPGAAMVAAGSEEPAFHRRSSPTGGAPVAVVSERSLARRLPGVWISARPAPVMAALFVRVADRDAAEKRLNRGGFHAMRMPDGSVAVGAAEAHGVAMVFG